MDAVFGYPSETNLSLLDAFAASDSIRLVQTQLEDSLTHAASGYAKASGRPAVVCAGGGAAGVSLLAGMLDAHLDSAPMIVLTGQVRSSWIGRNALRESDLIGLSTAVTKHGFRIEKAEKAKSILEAAFQLATTGRRGVVLVEIPEDIIESSVAQVPDETLLRGYRVPKLNGGDASSQMLTTLRSSSRPLLLLGGGAMDSAREWTEIAERLRLPVVTSFTGKGTFPETHPQSLGVVGSAGRKAGMYALSNADWLLAVGCRFSDRLAGSDENLNREDLTVCHVDIDAFELGKNVRADVSVHADAAEFATAFLAETQTYSAPVAHVEWLNCCATAAGFCLRCVEHTASEGVHPKHVMDLLNERKRSNDIVVTGTGLHHLFAAHFLHHLQPRTFIASAGAGAKGSGLPRAIGAALSNPGVRVILIEGEVSFGARMQELALARALGLNLKILVLDNSSMGWIEQVSEARNASTKHAEHQSIDYLSFVKSLGIDAYEVESLEELVSRWDELESRSGPALVKVNVSSAIRMSPLMPVGGTFAEYGGICMEADGQFYTAEESKVLHESAFGREDDEP